MIDITKSIIWQYNDNKPLVGVIENQQTFINDNVSSFFDNFYTNIYNVETADFFGLLMWAKILGLNVPAFVSLPDEWFGFNSNADNFNAGFCPSIHSLSVSQLRLLIQFRYAYLTTFANIDNITKILDRIITGATVLDSLKMKVVITYPSVFSPDVQYILDNFFNVVVPMPAGVGVEYRTNYPHWLDFSGTGGQNFNNGNFGG